MKVLNLMPIMKGLIRVCYSGTGCEAIWQGAPVMLPPELWDAAVEAIDIIYGDEPITAIFIARAA